MISTYTLRFPPAKGRTIAKPWIVTPVVLALLGYVVLDWKLVYVGLFLGIGIVLLLLYYKGLSEEEATPLPFQPLHLNAETIEIGSNRYNIKSLQVLRLTIGHYKGEPTLPPNIRTWQKVAEVLGSNTGSGYLPEFFDGTDSRLAFTAGGEKISVPFYLESEAQQAQFKSLLKGWYAAGIAFKEFREGSRTYLMERLNYAEIQVFKEKFGLKE
jgi:hypothetical protein